MRGRRRSLGSRRGLVNGLPSWGDVKGASACDEDDAGMGESPRAGWSHGQRIRARRVDPRGAHPARGACHRAASTLSRALAATFSAVKPYLRSSRSPSADSPK